LLILVTSADAQVAEHQPALDFPQDWTHRHLVFHRQMLWQHPQLAAEPRVLHQFIRKMPYSAVGALAASDEFLPYDRPMQRDWDVSLGGGKSPSECPA